MNGEECMELLMAEVTRIDIMPTEALKVSVPFNVPNIAEAQVTLDGGVSLTDRLLFLDSLLSLSVAGDANADAEMQEGISHKSAEKRTSAGMVRTHTLQVPIESGFQAVRNKEDGLQDADFHIVLGTVSGTRYLAYGLPNTSQFSIDDQMGDTAKMTAKVTLQSMSGFIKIV